MSIIQKSQLSQNQENQLKTFIGKQMNKECSQILNFNKIYIFILEFLYFLLSNKFSFDLL